MSYIDTMIELSKTASEGSMIGGALHNIGDGFQSLSQLDPRNVPGSMGEHVRNLWPQELASQAGALGNESLSITQKLRPAWNVLKDTATKYKNPLMAAGVLAAAAKTMAGPVRSAISAADGAYHSQHNPVTHNVYYK